MNDNFEEQEQQQENIDGVSLVDLQERYSISRDALHKRIRYLQMRTWKIQGKGKTYLDSDQVAYLDGLHAHMANNNGRMEGYIVPEPSDISSLANNTTSNEIIKQEYLEAENINPEEIYIHQNQTSYSRIMEQAEQKAASILIAEGILTNKYLDNPELINPDLRQKIEEATKRPKIDPFVLAASWVQAASVKMNSLKE